MTARVSLRMSGGVVVSPGDFITCLGVRVAKVTRRLGGDEWYTDVEVEYLDEMYTVTPPDSHLRPSRDVANRWIRAKGEMVKHEEGANTS